jgi:hypothetical protein
MKQAVVMALALAGSTLTGLGACSGKKSDDHRCEKARDKYLAHEAATNRNMLSGVPPERRAQIEPVIAQRQARIHERFVAVCKDTPNFDPTCFDDPPTDEAARAARGEKCKAMFEPMAERIFDEPPEAVPAPGPAGSDLPPPTAGSGSAAAEGSAAGSN